MTTNQQMVKTRKVKIGKVTYNVESLFSGERQIGESIEKLAANHVLDEIDLQEKETLTA